MTISPTDLRSSDRGQTERAIVPALDIIDVAKRFVGRNGGTITAVEKTNLSIIAGEFVTIVGPSGCGKSTLLNLMSGLTRPSEGTMRFKGAVIQGVSRHIGYITQQDNLMPWRTIKDNVAFPLEVKGVPKSERYPLALEWLERVGLGGFGDSYPHELSGGMRQRANIVRTLIYEPEILLMDEPFGPLDAQTRLVLQHDLLDIWRSTRKTVVFVTHDLTEAIALADRVILMSARPGRISRIDRVPIPRPRDIFHIHSQDGFRELYDEIWNDLETQVTARPRSSETAAPAERKAGCA